MGDCDGRVGTWVGLLSCPACISRVRGEGGREVRMEIAWDWSLFYQPASYLLIDVGVAVSMWIGGDSRRSH